MEDIIQMLQDVGHSCA
ncbi:hypothetical protein AB2762_11200 [Acinetobacter indicus]